MGVLLDKPIKRETRTLAHEVYPQIGVSDLPAVIAMQPGGPGGRDALVLKWKTTKQHSYVTVAELMKAYGPKPPEVLKQQRGVRGIGRVLTPRKPASLPDVARALVELLNEQKKPVNVKRIQQLLKDKKEVEDGMLPEVLRMLKDQKVIKYVHPFKYQAA